MRERPADPPEGKEKEYDPEEESSEAVVGHFKLQKKERRQCESLPLKAKLLLQALPEQEVSFPED